MLARSSCDHSFLTPSWPFTLPNHNRLLRLSIFTIHFILPTFTGLYSARFSQCSEDSGRAILLDRPLGFPPEFRLSLQPVRRGALGQPAVAFGRIDAAGPPDLHLVLGAKPSRLPVGFVVGDWRPFIPHVNCVQCRIPSMWPVSCTAIFAVRRRKVSGSSSGSPRRWSDQTPTPLLSDACPKTKFHPLPGQRSDCRQRQDGQASAGFLRLSKRSTNFVKTCSTPVYG